MSPEAGRPSVTVAGLLRRVSVVLVEPQSAGNVGAAARALHNMGLSRLVLVSPVDHRSADARRMAVGALPLLERARVVETLGGAFGDAGLVIGTTRRGGKNRGPVVDIREAVRRAVAAAASGNRVALVFGREDSGLTTAELDACHLLARIPTGARYPSLNLAGAVLVVAYELRRAAEGDASDASSPRRLATARETEGLYREMASVLEEIGFLNPQNPEEIMHALRRLLGRAEMDPRDVRILRGVLRQVRWAARRPPS